MALSLNGKRHFCNLLMYVLPIKRNYKCYRQLDFGYLPLQHCFRLYSKKAKGKKNERKINQLRFDDDLISFSQMKKNLQSVLDGLAREYSNILVTRITPDHLNRIRIQTKDGKVPLQQIAQVSSTSPNLLRVSLAAFPEVVNDAAVAIRSAGLNLNPIVEGTSLKVPIPKMTKEQREKLVKSAKSSCEKAKVGVRRVRQNCINDLRKLKGTSEDEVYETKDKIQILADDYSKKLEDLLTAKSSDILGK